MTIEWLGWLTKPHMLMTGLDSVIMTGEICVAVAIGAWIAYIMGIK